MARKNPMKRMMKMIDRTAVIILVVFVISVLYGIQRFGLDWVIENGLGYVIGCSLTAFIFFMLGKMWAGKGMGVR